MQSATFTARDAIWMLVGLAIMIASQVYLRPHRYDAGRGAVLRMMERDNQSSPSQSGTTQPPR